MADCRSIIDRIYDFYDFVSSGKKDRIRREKAGKAGI